MEENEKEDVDKFIEENLWLAKPCVLYEEELKDCKSLKSRFHQHFVYGNLVDCSQWYRDYHNCIKWKEENDKVACKKLLKSELSRRFERLQAHRENDIWEKRESPPANWNAPLPLWMEEKLKNSYLALRAKEVDNPSVERTFCSIM